MAFPVVGFFVGWLVGASRTPAVAALIPLLIGLLGAVPVVVITRRAIASRFIETVRRLEQKRELEAGASERIDAKLGDAARESLWLPALWSVGAVLFCVAILQCGPVGSIIVDCSAIPTWTFH